MWGFDLCGAHSILLITHAALLGLLGFWEVPVRILYGEQWTGEVVTVTDAIEPSCFGGGPHDRMEVSDCARQAWELVNVVDNIL